MSPPSASCAADGSSATATIPSSRRIEIGQPRRLAPLFALTLAWLATPAAVLAHAELVSSTPAANASLASAPSQLVLVFSEAIDAANSSVQLEDVNNQVIPGAGPLELSRSDSVVRMALPRLQPATYVVAYRVTSADDGHVTAGQFAFLVDPTQTQPPPSGSAQASSPSADPPTIAARWLALIAILCLVGVAFFWLLSARPALADAHAATRDATAPDPPTGGMPLWGTLALLAFVAFTALGVFLTLAAGAAGAHAHAALPLDFAAPFGSTPFAMAMRLMLVGIGATFVLATGRFFLLDEARRRGLAADRWEVHCLIAAVLLGSAALAGASLAGHAAAYGGPLFAAIDWLHLLGVTAWLGTLAGLAFLAFRLRRVAERRPVLAAALRRHSRVALVAAPMVALTGLANSPLVLGASRAVVASDYGDLVVAKAVLLSAAVAIGSANFFLVARGHVRRVGLLVAGEAGLGLVAAVAAATMLGIQPAASRPEVLSQTTQQPAHLLATAGSSRVHLAIDLPAPGDQLYQVAISDKATGATRTDVKAVTLLFTPPAAADAGPKRVAMPRSVDPAIWAIRGDFTPRVGDWTVRVIVVRSGMRESATFPLAIDVPLPARPVPPPSTGIGVPAPLAVLWLALPAGLPGWAVVAAGLLAVAAIGVIQRGQRPERRRILGAARLAAVGLVVVAGIGVGSHALVDAAGQPPPTAMALANPVEPSALSVERGDRIYRANCSSCHGLDGAGNGPQAGEVLPAPGAIGPFVARQTDGGLYYLVTNGLPGTRMPAFSAQLSENDRWDLVNYLRSRWDR